jgi:hypothetical protein
MKISEESAAWHEKKIFPKGDFLKLMPIFISNNFLNPFEGCSPITCRASVRQGFRTFQQRIGKSEP